MCHSSGIREARPTNFLSAGLDLSIQVGNSTTSCSFDDLQNVKVLRKIHVANLSPPESDLTSCEDIIYQILAEKRIFLKILFGFIEDSMKICFSSAEVAQGELFG